MYLKFFNLNSKPFEISPDPKFLWLGEKHKEGLATLKYCIMTSKGFMSITGDVGTGKTTLLNALAESFDDNYIFARIPDPSLEVLDFYNFTADAFAMDKQFLGKGDFLRALTIFLNSAYAENKEVILIVDEAQRIKQGLLEDIRLISNIEKPEKKLINIIFAGQNNFNYILNNNKALKNRMAINYQIEPLTENDTEEYISHRLKIAGAKNRIFSSSAIHEIHSFSKGNPRQTNIICDLALLLGYSAETITIEPAIIKECVKRASIPFIELEPSAELRTIQAQLPVKLNQEQPSGDWRRSWNMTFHRIKSIFSRSKAAYLTPVPLIILISLIGLMYYAGGYDSSIPKFKNYFVQVMNRYVDPVDDGSLHNAQVVNAPTSMQFDPKPKALAKNLENESNTNDNLNEEISAQAATIADLENKLEKARAELTKLNKRLHINRQATALLKTQVKELYALKAASEKQLANLQAASSASADDLEEQKQTKAQVADLKKTLAVKERLLSQSEQQKQELEKELDKAKSAKDQLDSELSVQGALVADLQNRLQASLSEQAALEAYLQNSRQETAQLQSQIKQLDAQKISAETRLENLQAAHDALAADNEKLGTTVAQVAELKNTLAVKERMLTQSEQRQQELEKDLAQAKSGKGQLGSELLAQAALVEDFENELETSRVEQAALEAQLQKSRQETALLESQLKQLGTQRTSADTRLENLQAAHDALAAEFEELKTTEVQVAELKKTLAVKERILTQSEQRRQELEKDLAQAISGKGQLDSELSSQGALVAGFQNKLQASREDQAALKAQLQISRQEKTLLQTQLDQLGTQKTATETRLEKLQTAHNVLAAELEELKTTKAQVAELKNALAVKERMLTQNEQRQQELEKDLAQAISGKDQLDSELSSQGALVEDLQNKLKASREDQATLKAQLRKNRREMVLVQAQLKELKAKTSASPVKSAALDTQKEPPLDEAESPNPANVIDWLLKKKSK